MLAPAVCRKRWDHSNCEC